MFDIREVMIALIGGGSVMFTVANGFIIPFIVSTDILIVGARMNNV